MGSNVDRRMFLSGLAGARMATRAQARRPNILLIVPDQLRAQALGCMGNKDVRTPHIDRLASEGLVLENTFANTPVCSPARAVLLTGRYAHRNGMVSNDLRLRESEETLAEILARAGYRTGFIGKWHLDGGPRLPGFVPPGERRQGFEFWAANVCSHQHFRTHYFRDSEEPIPMPKFEAEGWTDLGLEFLDGCVRDERPFFLTIQMGPPHNPYKAPEEYSKQYEPARLSMRRNWREAPGVPGPREIAEYYAMTTAVDDQVGRLLGKLDEWKLREDTIVLVTSDHGDMLGSHGLPLKRKPWEESIRVPGVLRYPRGVKAGRSSRALFSHVDFAPTLLKLCGLAIPAAMQGSDLSRVVLGQSERGPDSVFFQLFGPNSPDRMKAGWRGVRTARHMYARFENEPWVLYDLQEDPYELKNLVSDPHSRRVALRMERRLAQWMERTGDSWGMNWSEPFEESGVLQRHRAFYTLQEARPYLKRQ